MKRDSRTKTFKSLRAYVDAHTKTQGDIARELGLTQSALSRYLAGNRVPVADVALRVHRKTGIPLENLLEPQA